MEWCIKRLDGEHPLFVSRVNEILSLNPPDGIDDYIAAEEAQGAAFLASAVTGNDELYLQKHQEFIAACDEFAGGALQQLQAMSWEELLQGGAELATMFVLDGFVMKAATLIQCLKLIAGK